MVLVMGHIWQHLATSRGSSNSTRTRPESGVLIIHFLFPRSGQEEDLFMVQNQRSYLGVWGGLYMEIFAPASNNLFSIKPANTTSTEKSADVF